MLGGPLAKAVQQSGAGTAVAGGELDGRALARGVAEGNAVAQAFLSAYGTPGIGLLKFSALVVVVVMWATLPDRYGVVVLQAFALVSLLVVALNAVTLAAL